MTADPLDAFRWAAVTFEDVSLEIQHGATLADAMELLDRRPFDVAIIVPTLQDGCYRDVLRRMRTVCEDLPVVVVGALEADGIREAIALGAVDVVAPFDLERLGPALLRALREAVLAKALQRARAEVTLIGAFAGALANGTRRAVRWSR